MKFQPFIISILIFVKSSNTWFSYINFFSSIRFYSFCSLVENTLWKQWRYIAHPTQCFRAVSQWLLTGTQVCLQTQISWSPYKFMNECVFLCLQCLWGLWERRLFLFDFWIVSKNIRYIDACLKYLTHVLWECAWIKFNFRCTILKGTTLHCKSLSALPGFGRHSSAPVTVTDAASLLNVLQCYARSVLARWPEPIMTLKPSLDS